MREVVKICLSDPSLTPRTEVRRIWILIFHHASNVKKVVVLVMDPKGPAPPPERPGRRGRWPTPWPSPGNLTSPAISIIAVLAIGMNRYDY
jgi:hypothetical protein